LSLRLPPIAVLSFLLFLSWASPLAADSNGPVAFMPVTEVQRGMEGIGLTVFQGTRIDTFGVEVLGVMHGVFGPGADMVLAKLSGGPLEHTGVIMGMSGSPVYISGKLVGAVAYAMGAFAKEPIAGITPIGQMMESLNRPPASPGGLSGVGGTFGGTGSTPVAAWDAGELRPVATPLVMSGFSPRSVGELRDELGERGLFPVIGGGSAPSSAAPPPLEPGAALGVQLVRGDFSVTGVGTLTYREGNLVVGFGHPHLFDGATEQPMSSAYIHQVLPSQYVSFKLGAGSEVVGAIVQDRAAGIAGIVGRQVDMTPVEIRIRSSDTDEIYRMEVLKNRYFGPLLVRQAVASALLGSEKLVGETTVRARARLEISGRPALEIENVYAGMMGLGQAVLGMVGPMSQVVRNPFEPVRLVRATFDMEVEEQSRAATVDAVQLDRSRYEAGDTLRATVCLRPHRGSTVHRVEVALDIPVHAKSGRLTLRVSSATVHRAWDAKRAPGEYRPRDFPHLLRILSTSELNTTLIVELLSQTRGVTVAGRGAGALPPSGIAALHLSRNSGAVANVSQTVLRHTKVHTDYVLSGGQTVVVTVGGKGSGIVFGGQQPVPRKK